MVRKARSKRSKTKKKNAKIIIEEEEEIKESYSSDNEIESPVKKKSTKPSRQYIQGRLNTLEKRCDRLQKSGAKNQWGFFITECDKFLYDCSIKSGNLTYINIQIYKANILVLLNRYEEYLETMKIIDEEIKQSYLKDDSYLRYFDWWIRSKADYFIRIGDLLSAEEVIDDGINEINAVKKSDDNEDNEDDHCFDYDIIRSKIRVKQGNFKMALRLCKRSINLQRRVETKPETILFNYFYYIDLLSNSGKPKEARKILKFVNQQYNQVIWQYPEYLICKLNILRLEKNWVEAEKIINELILQPKYESNMKNLLTQIQMNKREDYVFVVDAGEYGNHARFINSSPNPNCYFARLNQTGCNNIMGVFSCKNIKVGDELTVDYGAEYEEKMTTTNDRLEPRKTPWEDVHFYDGVVDDKDDRVGLLNEIEQWNQIHSSTKKKELDMLFDIIPDKWGGFGLAAKKKLKKESLLMVYSGVRRLVSKSFYYNPSRYVLEYPTDDFKV